MTYPAAICSELTADMDRSDLAACHLCTSGCVIHGSDCPLDPTGIVLECVEYQPITKEKSHGKLA